METRVKPHGFVTKSIHWLAAGMVAYGYFKGLDNVRQLADPAVLRFEILFTLALGALFALRLFWTNRIAGATRLPDAAPKWEHFASKAVHWGLYASVFGIVLSGLAIALAYSVPALGWAIPLTLDAHEFTLAVLPVLLIAHIAGALWHKFIRRDGILESMTGRLPM